MKVIKILVDDCEEEIEMSNYDDEAEKVEEFIIKNYGKEYIDDYEVLSEETYVSEFDEIDDYDVDRYRDEIREREEEQKNV